MSSDFRRSAKGNRSGNCSIAVGLELSASKDLLRMARAVINCIMSAPNLAREFCQYVLSICEPAVLKWFHLDTYVGFVDRF